VALTAAIVKAHLPEFASTPVDTVDLWIAFTAKRVCEGSWGALSDDAQMWLVGHYLKMAATKGAVGAGAMTAKKVGPLSTQFKVSDWISKSVLSSTSYGREFLDLTRIIFPARCF
jgi:hypothetical protein